MEYAKHLDRDYEEQELIRIERLEGHVDTLRYYYNDELNQTIFSAYGDNLTNDDLVIVDGDWFVAAEWMSSSGNIYLRLSNNANNIIEGTAENDTLGFGDFWRYDENILFNHSRDFIIRGYEGADRIAGGHGNDVLDGGEEAVINEYGRDVDADDNLVLDYLSYIDSRMV